MKQAAKNSAVWLTLLACSVVPSLARADDFGDVSVTANAIYTGNTYHGYAEMRVILENRSATKPHSVTLVYPNSSFDSSGNTINRVARSVSLAPATREVVALLQPPLPARGDGSIRVQIDGRHEGEVRAPNANDHCVQYSRGGEMATVFVSRSLDYDAVTRTFKAGSGAFMAAKATGPPDARGRGYQANSWMPDTRTYGASNWLELDYTPQLVDRIVIHSTQSPTSAGDILLLGTSGTNLAKLPMSTAGNRSLGTGWEMEFSPPHTSQPVKTLRLEFSKTPPYSIAIDAVEIIGPSGSQWATDARASSDNSASATAFVPRSVNPDAVESLRAESPVGEWSENWLAYSPFDVVVVSGTDLGAMPPAVFAALGDYIHAGGNLVVLGNSDLPAAWHPARVNVVPNGYQFEVGFGSVFTFNAENPAALSDDAVRRLRETARETAQYFQSLPEDSTAANELLPVVENLKIPTRGIVIIMLAFVIVIGPVNLFYLNRIKRRTWMLWTIPAISFATTLLVFAYSLLREGITPDTRIAGLTVLDQASHHAATIAGEAFYCPLTPSDGLHFEFGTEATPLVGFGNGSGTAREVDWTQSQHFEHGWVSARVPAHFHVRKSETRRERIQVYNDNGKLEVVNSLGAPIKTLWFADAHMNFFAANNVPAGEKAPMTSVMMIDTEQSGAKGLWHDLGFASAAKTDLPAGKYLLPNTYVAVLDGNPFVENALGAAASAKRTKSSCVIFGILDPGEKIEPAEKPR